MKKSNTKLRLGGYLGCFFIGFIYFSFGFIQFLAMIKGTQIWFNIPWVISIIVSGFFAWVPIIGTIAGIKGAIDGWGWDPLFALILFLVPYTLYIIAIIFGGLIDFFKKIKSKHNNK